MSQKIILTICSNNYLSQARVLAESVKKYEPAAEMVVGLVDKLSTAIDYKKIPADIIPLDDTGILPQIQNSDKYDIVELNTAVKPFYFKYLLGKNPDCEYLYYLDPDTRLHHSLNCIDEALQEKDIVLTPHDLAPTPDDGNRPFDSTFLAFGIYNLGFLGIRRSGASCQFLDWFASMLSKYCFCDPEKGLFVDQLWCNFVPIFWQERTAVLRHPGCNMAYWNFHERKLSYKQNEYWVNDEYPLVFFHYSNYKPFQEAPFSAYQNRFTYEGREIEAQLYEEYKKELLIPDYAKWKATPCVYMKKRRIPFFKKVVRFIINKLKKLA